MRDLFLHLFDTIMGFNGRKKLKIERMRRLGNLDNTLISDLDFQW